MQYNQVMRNSKPIIVVEIDYIIIVIIIITNDDGNNNNVILISWCRRAHLSCRRRLRCGHHSSYLWRFLMLSLLSSALEEKLI